MEVTVFTQHRPQGQTGIKVQLAKAPECSAHGERKQRRGPGTAGKRDIAQPFCSRCISIPSGTVARYLLLILIFVLITSDSTICLLVYTL